MTGLQAILQSKTERQIERLAKRSAVASARLQELATGAEPSMAEIRVLANALGNSISDLIAVQAAGVQEAELLFRRGAGDEELPASTAWLARRIASSVDLVERIEKHGPWWRDRFKPPQDTVQNAEDNARVFRTLFCGDDQLSPLLSLPRIVSNQMGVFLFCTNTADLDGASAIMSGTPFVFVSMRFKGRMLFTLAHEIGHLVAHHSTDDFAMVDEDVERRPANRKDEFYANAFASALLMPAEAVGVALKAIRRVAQIEGGPIGDLEVNYLARIFGVSFWAAARRCEDLDLLPAGGAYALYQAIAKEWGSPERRADLAGLPPRVEIEFPVVPPVLVEAALERIRAGDLSIGRAADVLGLSFADLMSANAPLAH